jgi:integrase
MAQPQRKTRTTAHHTTVRPAVRVFQPDAPGTSPPATPPRLTPRLTLTEFFRLFAWPERIGVDGKPATLRGYESTLRFWELSTGGPPLCRIREARDIPTFWAYLRARPGHHGAPTVSPNTLRAHGRNLRHLFRLAGPRMRCEDSATVHGLFGRCRRRIAGQVIVGERRLPPRVKLPRARRKPPNDYFEVTEMEAWIEAARSATVPVIPGVPAPLWWEALIVYSYNTGVRIGTALKIAFGWHRRDDQGRLWVDVPGEALKCRDGDSLYVNHAAEQAMEAIRTDRALLFPWPHCIRHLHTIRAKLLDRAGIPANRRLGFHGLRKAAAKGAAEFRMDVARIQLGHATETMTREHYVPRSIVAATMEQMQQPRSRRLSRTAADRRQRNLFDAEAGD